MGRRIIAAFAMAFALAVMPAVAAEKRGTDLLFDRTALEAVENGITLHYTHTRSANENIPTRPLQDGKVLVSLVPDDVKPMSQVTMTNGPSKRVLDAFPVSSGNPVFVTFLETSVSSVTFATKGSPFYIRNRIKEAFSTGGALSEVETPDGPATQIVYHPFKNDRNAAKIGQAFEALKMTFVLSDDTPGKFISMTTDATVEGTEYFKEEVRFVDAKPSSD